MLRFRVDLKTWLCLTNTAMLSESKYLVDFLVGFSSKKPQTLLIPIYSTNELYDIQGSAQKFPSGRQVMLCVELKILCVLLQYILGVLVKHARILPVGY